MAQVDRFLAAAEELFPASMARVGVAAVVPRIPAQPGVSGTGRGAEEVAEHYSGLWTYAQSNDELVTAAATAGVEEAAAGRAAATGLRAAAQAQAAAMMPAAEASAAGMRALASAMGEKLAAMQHQVATSDRHNRDLASELRQHLDRYTDISDVTRGAESSGGIHGLIFGEASYTVTKFGYWEDVPADFPARPARGYSYTPSLVMPFGRVVDEGVHPEDGRIATPPPVSLQQPGDRLEVTQTISGGDAYPQFRPYREPIVGPSTGLYTPGKNWIQDSGKPASVLEQSDQFRIVGTVATTETRWVPGSEPGTGIQQRWIANVYEARTMVKVGGEGAEGSKAVVTGSPGIGIPPGRGIPTLHMTAIGDWHSTSLADIYAKSQSHPGTTFYLPTTASITDVDCRAGAVMTLRDGMFTGFIGDPQPPPLIMTKPAG